MIGMSGLDPLLDPSFKLWDLLTLEPNDSGDSLILELDDSLILELDDSLILELDDSLTIPLGGIVNIFPPNSMEQL